MVLPYAFSYNDATLLRPTSEYPDSFTCYEA